MKNPVSTDSSKDFGAADSTALANSPRLSPRGLTTILIFMCLVPIVTLLVLWQLLPPVEEGTLQASVESAGLPPAAYYLVDYDKRSPFEGGELIVHNESKQDWTHLNIQVNRHYQIYDVLPIPAGETARFRLDRFVSRTGARFSLQYNQLKSVRIYARRPTKDRATFYHDFATVPE